MELDLIMEIQPAEVPLGPAELMEGMVQVLDFFIVDLVVEEEEQRTQPLLVGLAAWEWAQRAASERPTDAEVLRMAAAIADWVGKPKDAEQWQRRFHEVQTRKELLSQDSPATEYLRIFETLQEAEKLEALKKTSESDQMFRKVLEDLKRLKDNHPDWESISIVQYRIRVLEKKLASPQQKP